MSSPIIHVQSYDAIFLFDEISCGSINSLLLTTVKYYFSEDMHIPALAPTYSGYSLDLREAVVVLLSIKVFSSLP